MEGMREHGNTQSNYRRQHLYSPVAVQACHCQPDAEEGSVERVLPAHQEDAHEGQVEQAAPAAFLVTVGVYVVGILGGSETQGSHPGIDDAIQHRVKLAAEDEEDDQDSSTFERLLHQRGDDGTGGQFRGNFRTGEGEDADTQEGVDDESRPGCHHRTPQEDRPQQEQWFLLEAIQPVKDVGKEQSRSKTDDERNNHSHSCLLEQHKSYGDSISFLNIRRVRSICVVSGGMSMASSTSSGRPVAPSRADRIMRSPAGSASSKRMSGRRS